MSEEVLTAAADLALVERLTKERDALQLQLDATRGDLATIEAAYEQRTLEAFKAGQRERVAVKAYEQQQTSYRELEALYTAMTERAQQVECLLREVYAGHVGYLAPDLVERIRVALGMEREQRR